MKGSTIISTLDNIDDQTTPARFHSCQGRRRRPYASPGRWYELAHLNGRRPITVVLKGLRKDSQWLEGSHCRSISCYKPP